MKKSISIILCILFVLSFSSCKNSDKKDVINFNSIASSSEDGSSDSDKKISSASDKETESDNSSDTTASTKLQNKEFTEFIENNEVLGEIVQKAKTMKDVKSFSFKLNAVSEDLIEDERSEHKADGAISYNSDKGLLTLQMKYDNEDIVVYLSKTVTIIAQRDDPHDEWEIKSDSDIDSDDDDEIYKVISIISKIRKLIDSEDFDPSTLISDIFNRFGFNNSSSAGNEAVSSVAQSIIDKFTSKEGRKNLLGYSESENTDGVTYSISPDLYECLNELIILMEPLFPDEDAYSAFSAIMSMQQLSMSGTTLNASLKLDKNDYLNNIKLNYSSASQTLTAELKISDINNAKVNIDSELQKQIDKKK